MGPINLENLEITLAATLEKGGARTTQLDPFLEAYQQWHETFEEKGMQIIQGNLGLLHHI